MAAIDFTYDDAQFDISPKLSISGDWITLYLSGESAPFTLESARFTGTHDAVPVWTFDGLKAWVATNPKALRDAREDELSERDAYRSADRAAWQRQFLAAAE